MRIKGRRSGRKDGHFARRVLVGYEYRPAAIFSSKAAIPTDKSLAGLAFGFPALVCLVTAIPTRHDG